MRRTLEGIKEYLSERGEKFPITVQAALKHFGIGRKALEIMRQGGILEDDVGMGIFLRGEISTRAANCLNNLGITSKAEAVVAIKSGRLSLKVRNYGWKSHCEVCKWAGLPKPVKTKFVWVCPHCGEQIDYNSLKRTERR